MMSKNENFRSKMRLFDLTVKELRLDVDSKMSWQIQLENFEENATGIDRKKVYVTNAVKHFKWEPRGKRRIHKKPNPAEIAACRPWLVKELEFVRPKLVVALGGTALL